MVEKDSVRVIKYILCLTQKEEYPGEIYTQGQYYPLENGNVIVWE